MFSSRVEDMFRGREMDYKIELQESAKVHLGNVLSRKTECGFFSLFYSEEGKRGKKRCLLAEYENGSGDMLFTYEELKNICPFYNPEIKSKCSYELNNLTKEGKLIQKLKKDKSKLRRDNSKLRRELSKNLNTSSNFL